MRAVWISRHGGPEVLELRESPDKVPIAGEVRIRAAACGMNFAELMARQGLYPDAPKAPCVVGYEAAGTIDTVGAGVDRGFIGKRVVVLSRFGAHADQVCVPQAYAFPIPDEMSFEEAAAIPVNYLTAYQMLFRVASIRPGESVLIHMAAGGVGLAVLQLCRTVEGIITSAPRQRQSMTSSAPTDAPIRLITTRPTTQRPQSALEMRRRAIGALQFVSMSQSLT